MMSDFRKNMNSKHGDQSKSIPDTVTAVENAFGKLVILIFMLVLAKFAMAGGKEKLKAARLGQENEYAEKDSNEPFDTDQTVDIKEAEK